MKIAIVGYGMPFGPDTLSRSGLGGSETSQLCMGQELAKLGLDVHAFTCVEAGVDEGQPAYDGVWYHALEQASPHHGDAYDHVIVWRIPELHRFVPSGKRYTLLITDFATEAYPPREHLARYEEIWAVSDWQRRQWLSALSGVALPNIWVTRNGISRVGLERAERNMRQLVFASRPERGLWELMRDGGIMERLPEFTLKVCGYADQARNLGALYKAIEAQRAKRPNVEFLGSLSSPAVRQLIRESGAYVMPTNYPETSCILARECIEQLTPMITTIEPYSGALPETMGDCIVYGATEQPHGSDAFAESFAKTVRELATTPRYYALIQNRMLAREDLYWDAVAREWLLRVRTRT